MMKPFLPDPKPKTFESKKYRAFIRKKPSLYSGLRGTKNDPIVAAHQTFGKGGMGMKAHDTHCIPLLHSEHQRMEHQKGGKTMWGNQYESLPLRCLEYVTEYLQNLKGKRNE